MSQPGTGVDDAAFEELYRDDAPTRKVPWDLGAPQPVVADLAAAGEFTGDVLDIGCGPGDNAVFLASRGLRVTGIDRSPTAVRQARARAAAQGVDVTFDVGDALELGLGGARFDTVLDSALFHVLTAEERRRYTTALTLATRPNARLHLLCFSTALRGVYPERHLLGEDDLRAAFGVEWAIQRMWATDYTTACTLEELQVSARAILGDAVDTTRLADFPTDTRGRVLLPIWHLKAVRAAA